MGTINENGQTCLELRGIDERNEEIVRNDYTKENPYGPTHPDAVSNGDIQGKGTGHGGHTAWLPDCTKGTTTINYSNFDTEHGGGLYDIKGRNGIGGREKAMASSLYNKENPYGANLVKTDESIRQGQYFNGRTTKHL